MIRAKVRCMSVKFDGQTETVELAPTNAKEGDNQDWSKWTPSGHINLCITNPGAQGKFRPGAFFWLDFTPIE